MKKVVILTLIAVLALGATLVAAPKIAVDNAVYDFGTVLEGVFVTHKFLLSNVGDEPLTITSVRVTCGCTATALSKTNLEPGESVELEANVDTLHFTSTSNRTIRKTLALPCASPGSSRNKRLTTLPSATLITCFTC
jgi:hypothetical protein